MYALNWSYFGHLKTLMCNAYLPEKEKNETSIIAIIFINIFHFHTISGGLSTYKLNLPILLASESIRAPTPPTVNPKDAQTKYITPKRLANDLATLVMIL